MQKEKSQTPRREQVFIEPRIAQKSSAASISMVHHYKIVDRVTMPVNQNGKVYHTMISKSSPSVTPPDRYHHVWRRIMKFRGLYMHLAKAVIYMIQNASFLNLVQRKIASDSSATNTAQSTDLFRSLSIGMSS